MKQKPLFKTGLYYRQASIVRIYPTIIRRPTVFSTVPVFNLLLMTLAVNTSSMLTSHLGKFRLRFISTTLTAGVLGFIDAAIGKQREWKKEFFLKNTCNTTKEFTTYRFIILRTGNSTPTPSL